MPEFCVLEEDDADVRQRKVAQAVYGTLRVSHAPELHSVFPPPSLSSLHTHIASELLAQLDAAHTPHTPHTPDEPHTPHAGEGHALVSLPLSGNGVVVDLRMNRRVANDATHSIYVLHFSERMSGFVPGPSAGPVPGGKRTREQSPPARPSPPHATSNA